jgi:hypothetical protein
MRPLLDLAFLLTPKPLSNGDVSHIKLWELARKFASTPFSRLSSSGSCRGDKFSRAYTGFVKSLNKGREITTELVDVRSCLKNSGYQMFYCQAFCCYRVLAVKTAKFKQKLCCYRVIYYYQDCKVYS